MSGVRMGDFSKTSDFTHMRTKPNLILGDELWVSLDSYRSQSLLASSGAKGIMQARKADADVITTTQDIMQLHNRVRNCLTYVFMPKVRVRDRNKRPILLEVSYYDVEDPGKIMECMIPVVMPGGVDIPNSFNTRQFIGEMDNPEDAIIDEMIGEYGHSKLRKTALVSKMHHEMRRKYPTLSRSTCSAAADLIQIG